jgi:hypothetical protein
MRPYVVMIAALALLVAAAPLPLSTAKAQAVSPQSAPACGDHLARMHKKPPHVRFVRCEEQPDRQGKPAVAIYTVPGRFAAQTEAALTRAFGLKPLRRSCCQWDGPAASYRAASGNDYLVTMTSPETQIRTRGNWRRVGAFEIKVARMTEEI